MPDPAKSGRRPFSVYLLVFLLFFQGVSALFGSIALVLSPDGKILKMPLSALDNSPFSNYLVPGLVLGILLGIFPLLLIYPLLKKPVWPRAGMLNIYKTQYWAWSYSIYTGVMLMIWIYVQVYFIGYGAGLQLFYGILGGVIVIVTVLPANKRHYYLWR